MRGLHLRVAATFVDDTLALSCPIAKPRCASNNSPLGIQFPEISVLKDLILMLLCGLKEEVALEAELVLQLARAEANRLMGVTVTLRLTDIF